MKLSYHKHSANMENFVGETDDAKNVCTSKEALFYNALNHLGEGLEHVLCHAESDSGYMWRIV